MRVRALCLLLLLVLAAFPAWSAAPETSPAPQVTLADIFAPAPVETGGILEVTPQAAFCFPACTTNAYCQSLCCATAVCATRPGCQTRVCNCSVCP
jgi:hypothetical protein